MGEWSGSPIDEIGLPATAVLVLPASEGTAAAELAVLFVWKRREVIVAKLPLMGRAD